MSTGIDFNIILNLIDTYGRSVTITPVTKRISNVTGDEELITGTSVTTTAYVTIKTAPWTFDKEGLIQGGDVLMLVKPTVSIGKDDKVTFNSVDYRVQDLLNRSQAGGTTMFKSVNLFRI